MKCRDINKIEIKNSIIKPHKVYTTEKSYVGLDTETEKGKCFLLGYQGETKREIIEGFDIDNILENLHSKYFQNSHNFFYNIEYDFNAIIKNLPFENIKEIADRDKTIYKDFLIKHIPNKSFSIQKRKSHHSVRFFDLAQFYNFHSLNHSAEKVLGYGKEKLKDDGIEIDKLTYDRYQKDLFYQEKLKTYLNRDCELTYKLALNLNNMVRKFIVPKNFYSQATFSQQYFLENLKQNLRLPPLKVLDFALKCYQGGRFEVLKKGYFEKSYIYDIKSAYPKQNVEVPDTSKGEWRENIEYEPDALISLFDCDTEIYDTKISPMKYQQVNNLLVYPIGKFKKVYLNKKEYETIFNLGYKIKINKAFHYFDSEPSYPYDFLKYFYELKEQLKKDGKGEDSWIPKIILNGFYGKTIQINKELFYSKENLGNDNLRDVIKKDDKTFYEYERFKSGLLFNPIVANEITANTRVKLFEDSKKYMNHIIGFQTDSMITDKPIGLEIGEKLGDWEIEKKEKDIVIIGSGVYQIMEDNPKVRIRGFNKNLNLYDLLKDNSLKSEIQMMLKRNIRLKAVMKRKETDEEKYEEFNLIKPQERTINLNFDKKRIWERDFFNAQDVMDSQINSKPILI